MGKPAARLGDMTVHGGTITVGCPTVLIGGKPAARLTDMHTCPMQTPAGPAMIPHVGGPIIGPGCPTILIGNLPAAVVGDSCVCVGPPDTIAPPGCPTVLLGAGGGGGGGGGAGGGGSAKAEGKSDAEEAEELKQLDVHFEDKGGQPISGVGYTIKDPAGHLSDGVLTGQVKRTGKDGNYEIALKSIVKAAWSKNYADVGDKVKMTAEVAGIDDGEPATMQVYIRDPNFADRAFDMVEAKVSSGKIEADWELKIDEHLLKDQEEKQQKNYSAPSFYFVVRVAGIQQRSGYLKYKDWLEIEFTDEDGDPMAECEYTVRLSDGSLRKGTLDKDGKARIENVPPGRAEVSVDPRGK
jgi:uncharacterized Zn-binding protein involved in type VI secretion